MNCTAAAATTSTTINTTTTTTEVEAVPLHAIKSLGGERKYSSY
jgi:hypothetical protein